MARGRATSPRGPARLRGGRGSGKSKLVAWAKTYKAFTAKTPQRAGKPTQPPLSGMQCSVRGCPMLGVQESCFGGVGSLLWGGRGLF